ncbi:MAG: hypothetical protein CML44_00560 [Rhodobacteraceae bacterium]|nr:hypothetical protein [Paracoccaceae bacterium]|tara:strand:+ start:3306 stop:3719 length:414 start_codon:yes stop_codon:yes gene_type:complete
MAIVEGTAYWASIKTPNTKFEPVYSVNLVVDDDTANDFASRGHKLKQMDEGQAIIIKRKVNGPNGMVRPAPRLLNSDKQEVNYSVGNGSKVKVQYSEYEGENKYGPYKGLDFQAIQVLDLVEYRSEDGAELLDGEEF